MVIAKCTEYLDKDGLNKEFTDVYRNYLNRSVISKFAAASLRPIAVAYKKLD